MIDLVSLGLCHGLMAIAFWRLLQRPDLDRDPEEPRSPSAWGGTPDA